MISKLIQIAVVLGCLTLSLGGTALSSSKLNTDSPQTYRLSNDTKPESYNISLRTGISEGHFDYDGHVSINILVLNATRAVTLHTLNLKIQRIQLSRADGSGSAIDLLPWQINNKTQFLIIPTKNVELQPGARWIALTFFEPFWARHAFPCFDEPDLKANVTIQITHGANYTAASNMPGTRHKNSDGTVTTRFDTSPPMSTYLIAFSVNNYRYRANAANASLPMGVYVSADEFNRSRSLLELSELSVKASENYFGIPFALPKLDQIVVELTSAAMENWGLITYPTGMLQDENTTITSGDAIGSIVAHEVAHQWFGNLVTPKWWTFTWLKEGLATFFQYFVWAEVFPEVDITQMFECEYVRVYDERNTTRAITRYVESREEINGIYNSITYDKGACVVWMLQHSLTERSFKRGITNYLRKNAFSAVEESDLFDELDRVAKEDGTLSPDLDVNRMFSTWTRQAGFPLLTVTRNYQNGSITISQERYLDVNSSHLINATTWWIPYNFATAKSPLFNDTAPQGWLPQHQRSQLIEPSNNSSWDASDWVLFNKQQIGFYRVMYDARNWNLLIDELHTGPNCKIHPTNRAQLIDDAHNFVKSGRLHTDLLLKLVGYLKYETHATPWNTATNAMTYINETLTGTEKYDSFRRTVLLSVRSAMALVPCKCGSDDQKYVCVIVMYVSQIFNYQVCPNTETQLDLLKGIENHLYPHHRFAPNSYKSFK